MVNILPNFTDTERIVLGYCMLNAGYLDTCRIDLEPDDFALSKHIKIWNAICRLYDAGEQVERVTVYADLEKRGEAQSVDGLAYLVELDTGLPQIPAISQYIRQLHDAKMRRRIIVAASHVAKMAQDSTSDTESILETCAKSFSDIATRDSNAPVSTTALIAKIGISELLSPRDESGVQLPWPKLKHALGGMGPGQMAVLMADTSKGKTSMALQIATCAALQRGSGVPVIWALEMTAKSNFQRMVTQLSGVYATKRYATAEERAAQREAIAQLEDNPIYFDTSSRSVSAFLATLRQVRAKTKVSMAIVDHLQLIRSTGARNRAQEVSENSRALKLGAMDLGIPFLVLSQVDRGSVKGDGKIGLHSAKESGDIENDADVVMWIVAGELVRDQDSCVSLHIGKQREGPSGFGIPMVFRPGTQTFMEVTDDRSNEEN